MPLNGLRSRWFRRVPWLERLEDRTLLTGLNFPNPSLEIPNPGGGTSVAGDFANNGKMDFATVGFNVLVYLNNGNGTFQPPVAYADGIPASSPNRAIAVGDFAGNGILDLAIASGLYVYILMGNGDGTFQAPVAYSAPNHGNSIVVGDFTGNGKLDIVTTNAAANAVEMLLGNGDGTFQAPIQSAATFFPTSLAVGDFTGNGHLGLAVDGGVDLVGQIAILPGNGDGTFGAPIIVSSNPKVAQGGIAAADLNGDGKLDLITIDDDGNPDNQIPGDLRVWMGNGDGTFQAPVTYAVPNDPGGPVVADLTGNGKPDLVVSDSAIGDECVSVLLNNGDGTFAPAATYDTATGGYGVLTADFHGDGKPDILCTGGYLALLTNKGNGTFEDCSQVVTDYNAEPDQIATGDLTGNGLDDIVTTQPKDNTISVLLNNGHGGFDAPVSYSTGAGSQPMGLALADLTGNGIVDIVVADYGTNNISIFFGNGDGTFQSPVTYATAGSYPEAVAVGDLTGDGKLDIVAVDFFSNDISVFLNNGNGTFGQATAFFDGQSNRFLEPVSYQDNIILGDFSGDGKLDAVISDPQYGVNLLPGNGDGTFGAPINILSAGRNTAPDAIAAGDFAGNGRLDLAVSNYLSSVYILLNQGGYAFQVGSIIPTPLIPDASPLIVNPAVGLAVGDLTGDGKLDVIFGSEYSQIGILVGNGDGTFQPPVVYDAGLGCSYPVVADFEGFGKADIAVSDYYEYSDAVTVLDNGTPVSAAPTVTEANDLTIPFRSVAQSVALSATVTSYGLGINEGTVTFSIFQGSTQVGTSVTSVPVSDGAASAVYAAPAGLPLGTYTIEAVYNPGPDYQASSDDMHTLTVARATTATTTVAENATVPFSETSQTVTFNATVTSGTAGVSEGTVTFSVLEGNTQIGVSVTSGTVSNGAARAIYTLPAGQAAGTYTIQAIYNPGPDFVTSSDDSHTLTVGSDPTSTAAPRATATFNTSSQSVSVTAFVTNPTTTVGEGTVTFTVLSGGMPVGVPVAATVSGGSATADYTLPAALAAGGTYSVLARYSDSSGDFLPSDNLANLGVLVVSAAPTTTVVEPAEVVFSTSAQPVTFNAQVTSPGGTVNGGTVTFSVSNAGGNPIGNPVDSEAVVAGVASATFIVPAGTPDGKYTIQAVYNGTTDFLASAPATSTLTVDGAPTLPPVAGSNSITLAFNQFPASIPLNATSPAGNPLTYSTTMVGDNPMFDMQQQYQFQGIGYLTAGATAYVLHSNQPATGVRPATGVGGYYLLRPSDGALFAYDGSGSYAHTFANGTPIATLGTNVYNDPALLMNAQPPVDYTTLYNVQQAYQFTELGVFTAGANALVLQSLATNVFANPYYLVRPSDGALFAYDGSGSYAHTFANTSPLAILGKSVFNYPSELINAEAPPSMYPQLYRLHEQYDLQELNGSYYTNTYGHEAQWIYSPTPNQYGQHWYTLTLSTGGTQALLRAWQGYADSATGAVLATLDPGVYSNPSWLTTATAPPLPQATASVDSSGNLTILLNSNYLGTFKVNVTVSDGLLSTSQTVTVSSVDTAPTLTIQQGSSTIAPGSTLNVPHESFPQSFTVAATSPGNAAVTTNVSVSSYSAAFALQQLYQFKGLGYITAGATAYVLQAAWNNSLGNSYFLLKADGSLYAYDGSGSYAHTFANGTPVATLGSNVYADPALLLNAQPAVDYATLYNLQQQYQFHGLGNMTAGASAQVFQSAVANSFGNAYYLLSPTGGLYAYDGSGSYAHSFASGTPLATLDPSIYLNPGLLLNARAAPALYPQLSRAEQQFDLQEFNGSFYTGLYGNAAKWLYSPIANANGQHWYTLVPSAGGTQALLYAWDGSHNSIPAGANPVATLDASVYADPTLLLNARAPVAATGVTASLSGGTLQVNAPSSYVGTFAVTVTATDGVKTTTQTFQVASIDTPPVLTPIAPQTASASGSPLQVTLSSTDAENDPVSYSAAVVGYSAAYNLQQIYHFTGLGYFTVGGVTAYVLSSAVLGGVGGFYLMNSAGAIYAYDGSGSYAHTFANSANQIATLDPSVYNTPTLLTAAPASATPAAVVGVSGNVLTIGVASLPVGTIFEMLVTASDGALTIRTGFLVTVTT